MKNLFLSLLLLTALSGGAQKIGGFYSGVLFNDTTKMVQQYELALAEYRGRITGYSYVTFIANDTFYWGIRKVNAVVLNDSLVVEEEKIVANNFPQAPAKKIGRIITIPLNGQDSVVTLNGRWTTNQTKKYYSVPGSIDLDRSTDSTHSPLIRHLQELNIIGSPSQAIAEAPAKKEAKPKNKTAAESPSPRVPAATTVAAPLPYQQRNSNTIQTIEAGADSLVLAFYDNGVVDGDTISVYVNGQTVIAGARLTTTATKKIILLKGSADTELLLVAENLGSIPPNTGLLTITDGAQRYQVNFSADMRTNARIVIRRKKP